MRRATIAVDLALLMSMQAFGAVATCVLLPCCATVPTQCVAHEQAPVAIHHAGHHHAGMHHAKANAAALQLYSAPACAKSHAGLTANLTANLPKARMSANQMLSPTAAATTALAPIVLAVSTSSDPNFSPPISPSGIPLRI